MKFTVKDLEKLNPEQIVAKHLEDNGYVVAVSESENSNGFDVVAIKDSKYITVEVKKACASTRSFVITPVSELAKKSDYLAIVTPSGNIHYEQMSDHLKLCRNDGSRAVTKIVNIFN